MHGGGASRWALDCGERDVAGRTGGVGLGSGWESVDGGDCMVSPVPGVVCPCADVFNLT